MFKDSFIWIMLIILWIIIPFSFLLLFGEILAIIAFAIGIIISLIAFILDELY